MSRQRAHYDHAAPYASPIRLGVLRDRLFSAPDARGNIPHLTRETADHESRRINATMYETVGQMDAALDARLQPRQTQPAQSSGGGWFGPVVLIGLGAAFAWWLLSDDEDETAKDVTPSTPAPTTVVRENPVVVVPPPVQHTTTNITPPSVPVVVPPPVRRRRRRHKPVAPTITIETKVETPTTTEETKT